MTVAEVLEGKKLPPQNEWPSSYEEFTRLFWHMKGLQLDQRRRESFWSATNQNLSKAYDKLEQQEMELERAYGQIQRYLENIREGLLLISRELVIQPEYSSYLEELFLTTDIKGRNFIDFIFPDEDAQADERAELTSFLEIVFGSSNASSRMINDVNPLKSKEIRVGDARSERRTVDATFTRISGESGVESLMVIFVDRTNEIEISRRLEQEETRHEAELETISAILKHGPAALRSFLEESDDALTHVRDDWQRLHESAVRTRLFKQVHSLKGVAKYYQLNRVAATAHNMEELISLAEQGQEPDRARWFRSIEDLESDIAGTHELYEKLVEFASTVSAGGGAGETSRFLNSLEEMATSLAGEQNKQVQFRLDHQCGELPALEQLQPAIIHLVRNAVAHGIEEPYERLGKEKQMEGRITIRAVHEGDHYTVQVSDDGAGIDFDRIRELAVERGLVEQGSSPTQKALLAVMFSARFSSTSESSELAGRGLGLNIVQDAVRALGGRIRVSTQKGLGARFTLELPG